MAKYKIDIIKLMMKNGKMEDFGSIHEENSFNRPVSELVKEKYISVASKTDLENAVKKAKELKEAEASKDDKED